MFKVSGWSSSSNLLKCLPEIPHYCYLPCPRYGKGTIKAWRENAFSEHTNARNQLKSVTEEHWGTESEVLWREVNPACGLCVQSWPVQANNKEPHSQSTPLTHFCFLVFPPANWWGPTVEFELRREIKRLQEYRAAGITNFCSKYLMHYSAHSHPSRKGRMILQHSGCVE